MTPTSRPAHPLARRCARAVAIAALALVGGLLQAGVASAAPAGACARPNVSGVWTSTQSNAGSNLVIYTFTQNGDSVGGSASYVGYTATISGKITGNHLTFTASYDNGVSGTYIGTVTSASMSGTAVSVVPPGISVTWSATGKARCAAAPVPVIHCNFFGHPPNRNGRQAETQATNCPADKSFRQKAEAVLGATTYAATLGLKEGGKLIAKNGGRIASEIIVREIAGTATGPGEAVVTAANAVQGLAFAFDVTARMGEVTAAALAVAAALDPPDPDWRVVPTLREISAAPAVSTEVVPTDPAAVAALAALDRYSAAETKLADLGLVLAIAINRAGNADSHDNDRIARAQLLAGSRAAAQMAKIATGQPARAQAAADALTALVPQAAWDELGAALVTPTQVAKARSAAVPADLLAFLRTHDVLTPGFVKRTRGAGKSLTSPDLTPGPALLVQAGRTTGGLAPDLLLLSRQLAHP